MYVCLIEGEWFLSRDRRFSAPYFTSIDMLVYFEHEHRNCVTKWETTVCILNYREEVSWLYTLKFLPRVTESMAREVHDTQLPVFVSVCSVHHEHYKDLCIRICLNYVTINSLYWEFFGLRFIFAYFRLYIKTGLIVWLNGIFISHDRGNVYC